MQSLSYFLCFAKTDTRKVKVASRKEYQTYIVNSVNRFYLKALFRLCSHKFNHSLFFNSIFGKFQNNRILFKRSTSTNYKTLCSFFAKIHLLKTNGNIISNLMDFFSCTFKAVSVNLVAFSCHKCLPCTIIAFKPEPLI